MLIIGSHVSYGKEGILSSVKEALSYNANTFMFYTGAPTNTIRKEIDLDIVKKAKELMDENNININNIICHAPYIVNLANKTDMDKWNFSIDFIKNELHRCDILGIDKLVLHPGNAVKISKEEGLNNIIEALNIILSDNSKCMILLETMAGKGSECGSNIEEITSLVNGTKNQDRIGICLDTCHLNDAGYDMTSFDDFLDKLTTKIDITKIKCIHLNDSKNDLGSHKDRHANLGKGTIGFDTLLNIAYNERLKDIPKILETPYVGDSDDSKERLYPPYKYEINMLKNKKYNPDYLDEIRKEYSK